MEQNTGLMQGLRALGQLQEINGLWFNEKEFVLDGYRFIGCRFDACRLHVRTTNFELVGCHIDENTMISYGDNPLKIIKLFNSRNEAAYSHFTVFAPERHPNGTISITGS